jgi:outer membrane protein TolC
MATPTVDTIQLTGIIVPAAVAIFVAVLYTRAQTKRDAREQLQATKDAADTQAALIRVQIETAKATAVALKEILGNIEVKVDGRLEKALEKIDRLEALLATVTGVAPPPPVAGQNVPAPGDPGTTTTTVTTIPPTPEVP